MSYEKAMKHHRNLRKCKKQANNYFGFDTGCGSWPNPRRNPYLNAIIDIRNWFRERHIGNKQYNRECIREAISEARKLSETPLVGALHKA